MHKTTNIKSETRHDYDEMFINPFTDYGFKIIFGTELSKDLLIEFLNCLIPEAHIEDVSFCNVEQVGITKEFRKAAFDILCRNDRKEFFLVEMQRRPQKHFQDRILFYTSFLVQQQMTETQRYFRKQQKEMKRKRTKPSGSPLWDPNWLYQMKRVYVICFLDYQMIEGYPDKYRWDVVRMDTEHHVRFGDALHEIYLEMPKFQLPLSQCDTLEKRFLYVLNHMEILNRMPEELNNQIFQKLKHIASMSRLKPEEVLAYQMSLMNDMAYLDSLNTSWEEGEAKGRAEGKAEGRAEGREEGKAEMAAELKRRGMDAATIAEISGLPLEEIEAM